MKITIVGAGPVGLLAACLLSRRHRVTVLDKRTESTRSHSLNISSETISVINDYIGEDQDHNIIYLKNLLYRWIHNNSNYVDTIEIETKLSEIAMEMGVTIRRGVNVDSMEIINNMDANVIIGADGAKSKIRSLVFNDELVDTHNVQYMVQLKYQTPGSTRPRRNISAIGYSCLNGLSGSDMVLDFESLAPPNDSLRKSGTLHIPVPRSIYEILSANNRGTYSMPWSIDELATINNQQIAKLVRIIGRYHFSLKWRGGWLENPAITVIPLNIYRSADVVRILPTNKLVMLVGDSSSGLVFERGLNKGWLETVKCVETLSASTPNELILALTEYSHHCMLLYEKERDQILLKHNKLTSSNKAISATGLVATSCLTLLIGGLLTTKMTDM
jgi:hypothetical protein